MAPRFHKTLMPTASSGCLPSPASARTEGVPSFEALYEEHFEFVWRCLRRFGVQSSVAEDAAQDTFVVLHRRMADLRPDASAKGFLFAVAMRVARDYRRAARRRPETLEAEPRATAEGSPFQRAAERQAAATLDRFLETLDDDKRAVFVLCELEGLRVPEVSELLSTNLNTIYSRLRAGRIAFTSFLATQQGRTDHE